MKSNQTETRVYYSETDHAGAVYYANYLKWFEIGRTEILRKAKLTYADFEKQGLLAPVVEVKCNYKQPARYNDVIIIKTKIDNIGTTSIKFNYEIINKKTKNKIAEGYTVNVFIDKKTRKPTRIPDKLRKTLDN
jgi:acyl-CoA thioester hydrolase